MAELKPKAGQLVRNERHRRWGQVLCDERKLQFETGHPGAILVWDTERRGTTDWPLRDLSVVVDKGKIVWEDPGLAGRLDRDWREAERAASAHAQPAAICEVCDREFEPGDLEDGVTIPADCCERCGLCENCRRPGQHDCDD